MAGDLTKWSAPDVPRSEGNNVKFKRKGGWFITKKLLITALILTIILLIVVVVVTKQLTEYQYKSESEQAASTKSEHSPVIRLSEDVLPHHFELKLKPYLDFTPVGVQPFTLSGETTIYFNVIKPTSTVTLNYAGTYINKTGAFKNNKSLAIKSVEYVRNLELYSVEFKESLLPTFNYSMHLVFGTSIGDEQKGFYRSRYISSLTGKKRWIGVTNLEPTYARRVFPCFDEPKFRSTFDISLLRLKNTSALANTIRQTSISDQENNAWIWDIFERTPSIPTHKIGILVADLTVSRVDVGNITLSVWTRADLFNASLNLIDLTASLLRFYHSYFTVVQPISKLDLVAIPHCMNDKSGAWGLITFSESLIFKNKDDKIEEAKFALEISKKVAEQWVGNLVSLNWWADMWIKDSISIYLAYLALGKVRPDYNKMSSFMVHVVQKALDSDSYPTAEEIHFLSDITDVWQNDYSALKGASLLHMIATFSSAKDLQEGINNYLEKWSGKVTTSQEFWKSFGNNFEKHHDIIKFVSNWLKEGYPVVNCAYNSEKGEVILDQKSFYLQHPPTHNSNWDIPITYSTRDRLLTNELPNKIWLNSGDPILKFVLHTNDSWMLVNLPQQGAPGFYRVNYDLKNWLSLKDELFNGSNPLDEIKTALLDDSYQLAKAGRLPYFIPLNFTILALKETALLPLSTIDVHLKFLKSFFHGKDNNETLFKNFIQKLFLPLLKNTDSASNLNDSFSINYTRVLVLEWACRYEISECINWANSTFKSWIRNENNKMDYLKSDVILSTGIRYGTPQDLDTVLNRSLSITTSPKERLRLLKCLTSTSNSSFILQLLDRTLQLEQTMENVDFNEEDVVVIWESLSENLDLKEDVLKFFLKRWDNIYKMFNSNHKVLSAIIQGATENLTEERHLTEVASIYERMIKENKVPLRSLKSALNRLIVKTAWRSTKFNSVKILLE